MVKYITYIILIIVIISCTKEPEIIELPLISYQSSNVKNGKLFYYSDSSFLIKNAPNNNEVIKKILLSFKKNHIRKNHNQIKETQIDYNFYKYTSITKTFLEKTYYIPKFSGIDESLVDQENAYLGSINFRRCENDSTKWESSITIQYNKKDVDIEIKGNDSPYYLREEILQSCY